MLKKNYKGRCEKRALSKCQGICKSYNNLQLCFADMLQADSDIKSFVCNVQLDEIDYTTDFVITKSSGDLMVRECVSRNMISKPMNIKLLDLSREYWLKRGVNDWGIVTNAEE